MEDVIFECGGKKVRSFLEVYDFNDMFFRFCILLLVAFLIEPFDTINLSKAYIYIYTLVINRTKVSQDQFVLNA